MTEPQTEPTAESYRQARFVRPPGACELILVRHGESAALHPERPFALVDGHGDPELSPEGRDQADAVGDRLVDEPIAAIYVTKLRRTHETAAPLAARLDLEPITDPDLHEVHLGEWEGGMLRLHAAAGHPTYLALHREQRWDVIPGAEPRHAFRTRVLRGIRRIADRHVDQVVAVVVHGGVIGALLSIATGADDFAFNGSDNASISHVVRIPATGDEAERLTVRRFNDTTHLRATMSAAPEQPT